MLFRHSDEMVTQQIEHMRGGQGTVAVKHLLNPDEMLGKGRLFAQNTIPPGASIGLHRHQGDSEAYYVIEGSGVYRDDDQSFTIGAGDLLAVPQTVGRRRIEQRDAEFARAVDGADRFGIVARPPLAVAADGPGADPDDRRFDTRLPDFHGPHCAPRFFEGAIIRLFMRPMKHHACGNRP